MRIAASCSLEIYVYCSGVVLAAFAITERHNIFTKWSQITLTNTNPASTTYPLASAHHYRWCFHWITVPKQTVKRTLHQRSYCLLLCRVGSSPTSLQRPVSSERSVWIVKCCVPYIVRKAITFGVHQHYSRLLAVIRYIRYTFMDIINLLFQYR